jgi:hypothetical protein
MSKSSKRSAPVKTPEKEERKTLDSAKLSAGEENETLPSDTSSHKGKADGATQEAPKTKKSKKSKKASPKEQEDDETPSKDPAVDAPKSSSEGSEGESSSEEEPAGKSATPKRTFTLVPESIMNASSGSVDVDTSTLPKNKGKYKGKTPMQAAKKAFSTIRKRCGEKDTSCSFIFSIQEITPNSKKSTFTYIGQKQKLEEPHTIHKKGKQYDVNFSTSIKAYKGVLPTKKPSKAAKSSKKTKKTKTGKATKKGSKTSDAKVQKTTKATKKKKQVEKEEEEKEEEQDAESEDDVDNEESLSEKDE